ncbi:MAG: DMT family transporter [Pseudomonadota bacterium]
MKTKIVGALAICLAATLWGLDGVVLTPHLYNLKVGLVVFLLHAIPFVLLSLFFSNQLKYLKRFSWGDIISFSLVAICGGALGTIAIVKALFLVHFEHLSIVILLQKLQPVFAITLAAILLGEKLSLKFLFWALVAILASYLLTFGLTLPHFNTGNNTNLAAMWALLAAFCFGSATVFGKKVLAKYSFQTCTYFRFGFTTLIMLAYVLYTGDLLGLRNVTPFNWTIFLIIAVTTGSGAIFIYYYGLKRVRAMTATICELAFPVSAITFDHIFHGASLTWLQWLAASLIILAIIKITQQQTKLVA